MRLALQRRRRVPARRGAFVGANSTGDLGAGNPADRVFNGAVTNPGPLRQRVNEYALAL